MSDNGMVWEDPPPIGNAPHPHSAIAAELRANPGKWAKIMIEVSPQMASYVKSGRVPEYQPAGSFEAVSRNSRKVEGRKANVTDIYARYIGDGS